MNNIFKSIMMTLVLALVPFMGISAKKKVQQQSDRQYWCALAYKMAQPVLENMAKGELQKNMLTEFSPSFDNRNKKVLYMECFGRLMAGVAHGSLFQMMLLLRASSASNCVNGRWLPTRMPLILRILTISAGASAVRTW